VSNPRHTLRSLLHRLGVVGVGGPRFPLRAFQGISASTALLAAALLAIPATASAYATLEGPPSFSAAAGLPDGRVYEQVSPADKNGNSAGAPSSPSTVGAENHYGYSSPDGDAVLFEGTGPMGESPWGNSLWFVATKNVGASGWSTRALMPRAERSEPLIGTKNHVEYLAQSQDLSHALIANASALGPQTSENCSSLWLTGPEPFVAGAWVDRPSPELVSPVESCGGDGRGGAPVGGTPDFSTVYFAIAGTLLPQDASRAPNAAVRNGKEEGEAWGLYEYTGEVPHEAGVLPDGSLSPFGAVPATSGDGRNPAGNQVSEDGSRLFFVSPDPASCEPAGHNDCAGEPPELYVHEIGQERAQLVSRDSLLGEPAGTPVAAPGGILAMPNDSQQQPGAVSFHGSYVFASPDGSQAFFQSTEALTAAAAEGSPGAEPKTYDFDVDTGSLTFLPGVQGEVLAVDSDGSDMAFMTPEAGGRPAQLNLWRSGAAGGTVTPVVQLPEHNASVPEARLSADGSVLVFQTAERLSSSFNGGGFEQIYRYDVPANTLGCVSCDPAGVTPRGNAAMSTLHTNETNSLYEEARVATDQRGISSGGERVFFDSPDPLVAQDTNTNSPEFEEFEQRKLPQGDDVYEWENGVVYLISTGQSPRNSFLLDSSENGDDVFFATAQGLVPGDTDDGYDIYDARIPQPGDTPPPAATPCEGATCQGAANAGPSVTPPVSASFSGAGNLVPEVAAPPAKTVTKKTTTKCKKGYVKKKNKCVKKAKAKKASHNGRAE
jgi:hypothetical protein